MTEVKIRNLTALAKQVYEANKAKGFWDIERNVGEIFMLIISEAAEALEGHRKGKFSDLAGFDENISSELLELVDNEIPIAVSMFKSRFEEHIKDSFEDELADVVIRCLDFVGYKNYDLEDIKISEIVTDNVGEMLIDVCEDIVNARLSIEWKSNFGAMEKLGFIINDCYSIAAKLNFDLDRHIELKLKYNATRPYKHGKKY